MIYSVAILCLIGITSCGGHWIEEQKTPTYSKQKWNIDSDFHSDSPKENDFDFHSTYEVIDTIPPDFSNINKYLGKSITLDFAPQEFDESEIAKLEEEIKQIELSTPPTRVSDERSLVPIREQVDDVQPSAFQQEDITRPALISKDVTMPPTIREDTTRPPLISKDNTTPTTIRKANTTPPTIRKEKTTSPTIRKDNTRPLVIHKYNTRSPISRHDYTEPNARDGPFFDYERKHQFHVKWN